MKLYPTTQGIVIESDDTYYLSAQTDWDAYINRDDLFDAISEELKSLSADPSLAESIKTDVLPPIRQQEVWASGVTYMKSREARMEESKDAGGGDFYARVYDADRPELFFKATAARTVGTGADVLIRRDSKWNVPEPELTLFATSNGKIVGYTCGNDMSSRDIEGENPLYLPQAKSYDGAAAIGPCLYVPAQPIDPDAQIHIEIIRDGAAVFEGSISINRMKRTHTELIGYLFRETSFPHGVFLMTGTGLVPPNEFTLSVGDEVRITIQHIGTLINTVAQKAL
ncbi:fumarylacetoacetate hydrolase family protein [Runella slithyformis]|uniref:Fumarylacetoacetate (FAA) hydrolase n=1 Tax=Runella slithyformis (strain ATCC 29530 / DSM 19594 / LMG 11500 / NCIMB 11436 / LSU 4) TaxID=761193 RepID=A0A7U4E935_RUNSL|nr:fumarylacetoacetate hydrolase family protein [Runella slithyformis]AEI52241.1 fumarylacetoacetate (FAA) hydrolase [Runella slithyformis DSM 19594]